LLEVLGDQTILYPKCQIKEEKTCLGSIPKFFRCMVLKLLHRHLFRDRPAPGIVLALLKMWNKRTMLVEYHFLKVDNEQVYFQ